MIFLARRLSFLGLALLLLGGCFFSPKPSAVGGGGNHDGGGGGDNTRPWEKYPPANTDLVNMTVNVNVESIKGFAGSFYTTPNQFTSLDNDAAWKSGKLTLAYNAGSCFVGVRDTHNSDDQMNRNLGFTFQFYSDVNKDVIVHFYLNDQYVDDSKVQFSADKLVFDLPATSTASYEMMTTLLPMDTFYYVFEIRTSQGEAFKYTTPTFSFQKEGSNCSNIT